MAESVSGLTATRGCVTMGSTPSEEENKQLLPAPKEYVCEWRFHVIIKKVALPKLEQSMQYNACAALPGNHLLHVA